MNSENPVLQLKFPVQFGDETFNELTFKRLKARHLAGLPAKPAMKDMFKLLSESTGLLPAQINELDAADTMAALEFISDFLGLGAQITEE